MELSNVRKIVITELYNLYAENGFITEDEALDCFIAYNIPLSEMDSITEHILGLGVLIRTDDFEDEDESFSDRSKLDYNEIFREALEIAPGMGMFIEYIREITPPQNREWQRLIPNAQSGNKFAYNRLVEMYLRIVIKQALYHCKRYKVPLEDTVQDGVLGLMIAIRKFDPASHDKFPTYVPWWIEQSISRRRWVPGNPMYFPVHVKDPVFKIQERLDEHCCEVCWDSKEMICQILCADIAANYDLTPNEAAKLIFHLKQYCSLNELEDDCEDLSDRGFFNEIMSENADLAETVDNVRSKMLLLKEKEQRVLDFRFGLSSGAEQTLAEVGTEMNVTRERIRQIEAKALRKLRAKLDAYNSM